MRIAVGGTLYEKHNGTEKNWCASVQTLFSFGHSSLSGVFGFPCYDRGLPVDLVWFTEMIVQYDTRWREVPTMTLDGLLNLRARLLQEHNYVR
jgi:hypothetical protein